MSDEEIREVERAGDLERLEVLAARVGDERRVFALRCARGVCPMCEGSVGLGPGAEAGKPRECCCGTCYELRRGADVAGGPECAGLRSGAVVSVWHYVLCRHCPHIDALKRDQERAEGYYPVAERAP